MIRPGKRKVCLKTGRLTPTETRTQQTLYYPGTFRWHESSTPCTSRASHIRVRYIEYCPTSRIPRDSRLYRRHDRQCSMHGPGVRPVRAENAPNRLEIYCFATGNLCSGKYDCHGTLKSGSCADSYYSRNTITYYIFPRSPPGGWFAEIGRIISLNITCRATTPS